MALDITIHGTGTGQCSLSGKETEGMTVSFKDGTLQEGFLSQKAFMQLIKMKLAQPKAAQPRPAPAPAVPPAVPAGNGAPAQPKP